MADPMKLAMTVSLVDKLTAPAKKVSATVKSVSGKFGDTARMAKNASGALRGVADGLDDAARRGAATTAVNGAAASVSRALR